jgi:2-dehydro-3-deoxyphosphooctonate aldolase (KDO 8-P synthase)
MDCTHAVQKPNQTSGVTGGDPSLISSIVYSAVANGADGLFIETHPDPKNAKSDPHTMLKLDLLYPILKKALAIRKAIS